MDIILKTNTSNPFFAFRRIARFGDGFGFSSLIEVRSGWLSINYEFIFEQWEIQKFIEDLEQLDRTLKGQARPSPGYEGYFLQFAATVWVVSRSAAT